MNIQPGDQVKLNEHAPTRNGEIGVIVRSGRAFVVRFEDGTTGTFLPDEVEIVPLLAESANFYYIKRGENVLCVDHGRAHHYCIFSQWEKSPAFKRGGKGGASVSMAPDKFLGGFGATRLA